MAKMIRVRAAGDALVAYRAPGGALVMGRFVGRATDGAPLEGGEMVEETSAIRRSIARGNLARVASDE